jgi:hypothetical protein
MGYAENDDQKGAVYHNVLFEKNSEVLYRSDHNLQSYFAMNDGKSYSYIRTTSQSEKSDISLWQRSIVFFNHLGSFVMLDYAETKGRVESVSWRMHTWIEPTVRGRDNRITVSYPGGPNLRGLIAFPQDVVISHEFVGNGIRYRETDVSSRVYRFNRINVDLPGDSEVYRLVTGFVPYDDQESVVLEPVSGVNFEGVMAESRLGTAAALFCKDNSKESGSYRLPVADSPFNVVTNLVPNKQYRISVRRNGVPAANYRKVASSVGTIDFAVGGQGIWQISIEQMP